MLSTAGRGRWLGLALALALVTTGCADGGGSPEADEGCGRCEAEVAEVRQAVEGVRGVVEVEDVRYVGDDINDDSHLRFDVGADTDPAAVADSLARIAWESQVTPVGYVLVHVTTATGDVETFGPFQFEGESRAEYVDRWGPRPVP